MIIKLKFYYLDVYGNIQVAREYGDSLGRELYKEQKRWGNVFDTKKEAQKARKEIRKLFSLLKHG